MKYVTTIGALLFTFTAHAQQVTCQTVGTTATCNGPASPATQPPALGSVAAGMQQAQQAQADEAQTRANAQLAAEQAALVREQREALQQQREAAAAEPDRRASANVPDPNPGPSRGRLAAAAAATPTEKLKATAATLEAVMRSAPPDSRAFHDAMQALQATNEELVKRGALK